MTSSLIAEWAIAATPPPKLTVSEWADATRVLPEASAARGARWRTDAVPYLRGIMNAVHEPGVKTIALMKCHQSGGPLAIGTPVPTPSGWTTMGDIGVGDTVFDEHGAPCAVIAVSEVFHGRECFAVQFSDGSYVVCDAEHPWAVESDSSLALESGQRGRPKGSRGKGATRRGVLRTDQIRDTLTIGPNRHRYAIPVAGALSLPEAYLPLDPYVLGVWLGDGHSYSTQVSQSGQDAEELASLLDACGLSTEVRRARPGSAATIVLDRVSQDGICIRGHVLDECGKTSRGHCAECHRQQSKKTQYGAKMDPVTRPRNSVAAALSSLGLLKGRTCDNDKRIPPAYLRSSRRQRTALLQGLMDTDGHVSPSGACEFSTVVEGLCRDAIELLRSLGLKPTMSLGKSRVKRGTSYVCRPVWRVRFVPYREDISVFRLTRKAARQKSRAGARVGETTRRRIVGVEPVPSLPVRCIAVSSDSHLFLAGRAMIPTHNSEALHNILGYHIQYDPCAMMFVHPTEGVAEEWSKERLADVIRSTPAINDVVRDRRPGRSAKGSEDGSTLSMKVFAGGFLAIGGANTENTFARWSVRIAYGDDVDRFPAVVGEEGDPADLLRNRTTSFYDGLTLYVSTPTLKGGRIDTMYARSDQRKFFLTCPACGREDFVTWQDPAHFHVGFDDRDPKTARLECASPDHGGCGVHLSEPERRQMVLDAGRQPGYGWRPTAVASDVGAIGFQLPAMVVTLGSVTLETMAEKWLSARERGKESLRVFVNTALAEGWEDRGARMNSHALLAKREDYGEGVEVPGPAVVLTAGVDVQLDRFEVHVVGWGLAHERWVVDYRVIPGDPKAAETQAALLDALTRRYDHESGHQLPIAATCVDTGYATEEMYSFVLAHQARRVFATKGVSNRSGEPIVGKPSERKPGRSPRPVRLYPVNVDDAKSDVVNSLGLVAHGPGSTHFPMHLDSVHEEYFAQLCAEHRETRYNKHGVATHAIWIKDRDRNEALDTMVLAIAAFRLLNANVRQMAESLASTPIPARNVTDQRPPINPPAPSSPVSRHRVVRSSYLG